MTVASKRLDKRKGSEVKWWDVWQPRASTPVPQRPSPGQFRFSSNTGTYAIEAALLMGFRDLRLLGIDLRYDLPTGTHCYGDGRKEGCHLGDMKIVLSAYKYVAQMVNEAGGTLVNESPYAGPLDGIVPRRKSEWLINGT